MPTDLRAALHEEAIHFADRVYERMIAQLTSLLGSPAGAAPPAPAPVAGPSTTRERLSQEAIEEALAQIVGLLEKHPRGLRSEQIRGDLKMSKKLFQYAANLGKTSDQLTQTGERRTTTYSLPARLTKVQEEGRKAQQEGRVIRKKKR